MACRDSRRRLVVNADDFGRSHTINQAVIQAHREGILTTASLMVNGEAASEAVQLARQNPGLGVGLHLTLVCGQSVLPVDQIPGLVRADRSFSDSAVRTGFRYFFHRSLRSQIAAEITAQIESFHETDLTLDHVNGHLNLHLHPSVFQILMARAREWGIHRLRLTRDPLFLNLRLAGGQWFYRLTHAAIFSGLGWWARPHLCRHQIGHTARVFGLLQNGRVDEEYVVRLLAGLPAGDSELYSHPCIHNSTEELRALISSRVREQLKRNAIQLVRYQDL